MATTKNIIMKQFNGTDYDTLYPKTVAAQIDDVYSKSETYSKSQLYTQSQLYTRQQILSDTTKTLFGLGSNAIPDDVFSWIGQEAPRIETGTYVGTGVKGEANPNSLTFGFIPKVVFVVPDARTQRGNGMILVQGASTFGGFGTFYTTTGTETLTNVLISWSGKSVSWYCPTDYEGEVYQQNESGVTYHYVAFG